MDAMAIEVLGLSGAFYKAYIQKVSEESLTVVYEHNLQLEVQVPFACVRLPPPTNDCSHVGVGEEVEVYARTSVQEPCGWWLARVTGRFGEYFQVQYACCSTFKDVVTVDNIRKRNAYVPLMGPSFRRIPVPEEPSEIYSEDTTLDQDFKVECLQVPRHIVGTIIGKCGKLIQAIEEKSGLDEIIICGDSDHRFHREKGMVPFGLRGTTSSIETARGMLEERIAHLLSTWERRGSPPMQRGSIISVNHSSAPIDESWESEAGRKPWYLTGKPPAPPAPSAPPAPKVSKAQRQRRNRRNRRNHMVCSDNERENPKYREVTIADYIAYAEHQKQQKNHRA